MISQTAEYALRAVVDLAFHDGAPRTAQQVSRATHVPVDYLAKVLKELHEAGVVVGRRGRGGGFTLARKPSAITVHDVLLAVDPPRRIRHCPLGLKEHAHALCPLHRRLDDAMAHVEAVFRATTIAEVTASEFHSEAAHRRLGVSGGLVALTSTTGHGANSNHAQSDGSAGNAPARRPRRRK